MPIAADLRVKFAAEAFTCDDDPGAWPQGASDNQVAVNRRQASGVIKSCKRQLQTLCQMIDVNGQLGTPGTCPTFPIKP